MDAAEYKHLVLGLIFVKYISDTFAARRAELTDSLGVLDLFGIFNQMDFKATVN